MGKVVARKNAKKKSLTEKLVAATDLRLDLGCGVNKKAGFIGVDSRSFPGVDMVTNLMAIKDGVEPWRIYARPSDYGVGIFEPWPWGDGSVTEIHCSHMIEHLTVAERAHFVNELYRVLKPGAYDPGGKPVAGFATLVAPFWTSTRAYGDLTHVWPPVADMWFHYLDKNWRNGVPGQFPPNAPHNDFYQCDFVCNWHFSIDADLNGRNEEYVRERLKGNVNAIHDVVATLVKR